MPNSLPSDVIELALQQVKVALTHGNKSEAMVAIHRAFEDGGKEPITVRSPIARLDLIPRLVSILEASKLTQVGHLSEMSRDELLQVTHVGLKGVGQIRRALKKVGMKLRQPQASHGVPKWAVDLKVRAG